VAQNGVFTSTLATTDRYDPGSQDPATAPSYIASRSPANWVYFTHSGFGTGAASRSLLSGSGGTTPDHYFLVTAGASGGTITSATLEWTNSGGTGTATQSDFDIIICTVAFTDCSTSFGIGTTSEVYAPAGGKALAANTTYFIAAATWTTFNNIHNLRLRVVGTGIN
jgi:hypothetical protein